MRTHWRIAAPLLAAAVVAMTTLVASLPAEDAAKDQAKARTASFHKLKIMMLAMHEYHDKHEHLPAAYSSADGKPLLSWRVALLPFIDDPAAREVYLHFHLNEPWDSEHNKTLIAKMPAIYQSPASKLKDGRTVYLTPRGDATAFPGAQAMTTRNVLDGLSRTIFIVEVDDDQAVVWTKPDDWEYDPDFPLVGLGNQYAGGFNCAYGDGSAHFISTKTEDATINALLTIAGNDDVPLPQ